MAVNMERLAKSWGWSRPSVMRFVRNLEALNVLEAFYVVTSKMVRLEEDVIIFESKKRRNNNNGEDFPTGETLTLTSQF